MRFAFYYLPRMVYEVLCLFQYGSINFMILSNKIVGLITGKLQCQSLENFNLTRRIISEIASYTCHTDTDS